MNSLGDQLRAEGFAVAHGALDANFLEGGSHHLSTLVRERRRADGAAIVAAVPTDEIAARLAAHEKVVEIAEAALGLAPVCFGLTYFQMSAEIGLEAAWHHDLGPWSPALGGSKGVTLRIALKDAEESNGCSKVLPGSHLGPPHLLESHEPLLSMFGVGIAGGSIDERDETALGVEAGAVVVLDPNVIHGSAPNLPARDRVALGIRYRTIREREERPSGITALVGASASVGVAR